MGYRILSRCPVLCLWGFTPFCHGAGSALSQMCPRASMSSESGLESCHRLGLESRFNDFTNLHLAAAEFCVLWSPSC